MHSIIETPISLTSSSLLSNITTNERQRKIKKLYLAVTVPLGMHVHWMWASLNAREDNRVVRHVNLLVMPLLNHVRRRPRWVVKIAFYLIFLYLWEKYVSREFYSHVPRNIDLFLTCVIGMDSMCTRSCKVWTNNNLSKQFTQLWTGYETTLSKYHTLSYG